MKKCAVITITLALLLSLSSVALAAAPVDIERRSIDGCEYIIKTYEVSPDTDAAGLIEDDFEEGGFLFAHHTTTSEEMLGLQTKPITETVTSENQSKDLAEVLKKFPATFSYNKDGFSGTLILDTGSISTEVSGYETKSSTVSTTKEFFDLMYADPSSLPQSAVKNGMTLPLSDVSWTVTGTSLAGDSLVPTEYKATATYAKKVSSQVPTGYVSTATYSGEVSKTETAAIVYTLTYKGTLIPAPEPEVTPEPKPADPFPWYVVIRALAVLMVLGGGVFAVLYIRSRQGVQVFNLVEQDYLCIGRQRLEAQRPVIDLNEFADVIQSNFFSFVLDKSTTRKLFGRNITVTRGDITMHHMVKETGGTYRFNLEMGMDL